MFVRWALPLLEVVLSAFWCEQRVRAGSPGEEGPRGRPQWWVEWVGSPSWPCVFSLHFIAQLGSLPPSPCSHLPAPTPNDPCLALQSGLAFPIRPRTGVI